MLDKIKKLIADFKLNSIQDDNVIKSRPRIEKHDMRDAQVRKRVAKAFEAQEAIMNARALQPHQCLDPVTCQKVRCWKWVPDKVVSKPYDVDPLKKQ